MKTTNEAATDVVRNPDPLGLSYLTLPPPENAEPMPRYALGAVPVAYFLVHENSVVQIGASGYLKPLVDENRKAGKLFDAVYLLRFPTIEEARQAARKFTYEFRPRYNFSRITRKGPGLYLRTWGR